MTSRSSLLSNKEENRKSHHHHLIACYLLCGIIHELAHVLVAAAFFLVSSSSNHVIASTSTSLDGSAWWWWMLDTLYGILLGRRVYLPTSSTTATTWVRHAGWMTSLALACWYHFVIHKNDKTTTTSTTTFAAMKWASRVTAIEAILTDLCQWGGVAHVVLEGTPVSLSWTSLSTTATMLFRCGNFGILLLHQAWLEEQGRGALDVLQTMVRVTMMRGAQSGGVVTFRAKGDRKGIRTRVVNKKRTDLSLLLRRQIQHDVFSRNEHKSYRDNETSATFFCGHTRFATSSMASLPGTHPQQWTPPRKWKIYPNFYQSSVILPQSTSVENYITHNGDFDFYRHNGKTYDLETVQHWLATVTHTPIPAMVDSCAVAGMLDVLRTRGSFGLSTRYAAALGMSNTQMNRQFHFPDSIFFEKIGTVFEDVLTEVLKNDTMTNIENSQSKRNSFALRVESKFNARPELLDSLAKIVTDPESGPASVFAFCMSTVNAFFDNDLFYAMKTFLQNASGSFGLCFVSSLDSQRQICLAARGQTMSIAFYPDKGLVCYGSEQAAVKAGMSVSFPRTDDFADRSRGEIDNNALRLDLDDLGGEVVCLDWGFKKRMDSALSVPNRHIPSFSMMNGALLVHSFKESKGSIQDPEILHRMTRLTNNPFIKPLPEDVVDWVKKDIQDIPRICYNIQADWHSYRASSSLNRLTAFTLSQCLRDRLDKHAKGLLPSRSIDILVTGCEVSLWLGEQFAADLKKCFPRLNIESLSSNKILGLFGQDIPIPTIGFPISAKTHDLQDTIVIIVSHSGGTFAPLSCSNLLQSTTRNIFVVTSEWDTQIGKQLRIIEDLAGSHDLFANRVFTTECGMRPAEPCSLTVAATQQLLTNILLYTSAVILSNPEHARVCAATVTEVDLQTLEKCNRENIEALTEIVGTNKYGYNLEEIHSSGVEKELRIAGDIWANHILEVARAYCLTIIYIFVTVITGYPLFYAIAYGAGLNESSPWFYLVRAFDSLLYLWLPQINVLLIRLIQGRNLLHRISGRTVVIGDIPWVAQCADAFLSKLFAVSYSIAGLTVMHGNPADHFVHRLTHRVVRGTLLIAGRPDGRLSALSTAEASVCLAVNQASSIQSLGGTCESVTIGHNPFMLPLSSKGIFLKRKRPLFICERILTEQDAIQESIQSYQTEGPVAGGRGNDFRGMRNIFRRRSPWDFVNDTSLSRHADSSIRPRVHTKRSATALLGAYMNLERKSDESTYDEAKQSLEDVIESAIKERKWNDRARKLYHAFDLDGDGFLSEKDFIHASLKLQAGLSEEQSSKLFKMADEDSDGHVDYDGFLKILQISNIESGVKLPSSNRDERGLVQIEPSRERYFGEALRKLNSRKDKEESSVDFILARSQHLAQELYETRIASLQRFVSMSVMFHQMGVRVQNFFSRLFLGYRMDRTHSIMRIATTASPVSGADVRDQMVRLRLLRRVQHSIHIISEAYLRYKEKKAKEQNFESEKQTP